MGPEVIVPVAMFAVIFGCVYLGVTAKHKQRMAMIEKGMDPSLFKERTVPMRGLRNGMVLLAVGIGLMLGRVAEPMFHRSPDEDNPLPYFVCVLVCAGLALITHHFIVRKEQQP